MAREDPHTQARQVSPKHLTLSQIEAKFNKVTKSIESTYTLRQKPRQQPKRPAQRKPSPKGASTRASAKS